MQAILANCRTAEDLLKQGGPADLENAVSLLVGAIDALQPHLDAGEAATRFELACAWINYGNGLLRLDNRLNLQAASEAYRQAIAHFDLLPEPLIDDYAVERSAAWANLAHTFQLPDNPSSWQAARGCYQVALQHLKGLPDVPRYLHRVAGTWLNLANCEQLLERHAEAVAAYDEAEAVLTGREHHTQGQSFDALRIRIWLNRANTLTQLGETGRALADLDRVIGDLQTSDPSLELAAAFANRANLLTTYEDESHLGKARRCAREGWELARPLAHDNAGWAEVALQAARAELQALTLLVPLLGQKVDTDDLYFAASDLADEAMALYRAWQTQYQPALQPLGRRIFHLGAQLYAHAQPQFLSAFLCESLDESAAPDAVCHDESLRASAQAALEVALYQLRYERQVSLDHAEIIFHLIEQLVRTREHLSLA
ncbi:MAG: hypothetical protein Q7P63_14550 [Verrucomicrobiota bacterium JB022]|nr:hypothetical protein [Verrucomicrobiota bacterium JB022]